MIRVRQNNGDVTEIPDGVAVEILDTQGRAAVLFIQHPTRGAVQVAYPGEPLFTGYCRVNNLLPSKVQRHTTPTTH